jgi:hypothetical protein
MRERTVLFHAFGFFCSYFSPLTGKTHGFDPEDACGRPNMGFQNASLRLSVRSGHLIPLSSIAGHSRRQRSFPSS